MIDFEPAEETLYTDISFDQYTAHTIMCVEMGGR